MGRDTYDGLGKGRVVVMLSHAVWVVPTPPILYIHVTKGV